MPGSQPLRRATEIMDVIAAVHGGVTVSEISRALRLPKPTVLRIVGNLVDVGYAQGGGRRSRYTLGPRFHRQVQFSLDDATLESLALPVLRPLAMAFEQTVFMTRLVGQTVGLAATVFPENTPRTLVHPGEQFPFHATSAGKVICANQGEEFIARVLSQPREAFRPATILDSEALRQHLVEVKARGYATIDDELDEGVYAASCPVPAGHAGVLYSVGVVGLRDRLLSENKPTDIIATLRTAAATLSSLFENLAPTRSRNGVMSHGR